MKKTKMLSIVPSLPILLPPKFRLVVEMSTTFHADEWVCYLDHYCGENDSLPYDQLPKHGSLEWVGGGPTYTFCRPIFEVEAQEGLQPYGKPHALYDCGMTCKPESTQLLDAIFRLVAELRRSENVDEDTCSPGQSPSEFIARLATRYFYKSPSGIPTYLMSILRYLIETVPGIDFTISCGDGKTLRDFYEIARKASPNLKKETRGLLEMVRL